MLLIGICLFLILVILLQKGRGEGLAGAFGGGGGSGAFGAKTGDVFTLITVVVAGMFVLVSVIANYAFDDSEPDKPAAQTFTIPIDEPTVVPAEPITIPTPVVPEQGTAPATTDTTAGTDQPPETDKPGDG